MVVLHKQHMQQPIHYIKKFIIFLIALQILNVGLYAQDYTDIDTSVNIINSVTEYFAEVVCHKKDAFPENDNDNQKSETHTLKHAIVKAMPVYAQQLFVFSPTTNANYPSLITLKASSRVKDVLPRPPQT
jgi:hypothetical protein